MFYGCLVVFKVSKYGHTGNFLRFKKADGLQTVWKCKVKDKPIVKSALSLLVAQLVVLRTHKSQWNIQTAVECWVSWHESLFWKLEHQYKFYIKIEYCLYAQFWHWKKVCVQKILLCGKICWGCVTLRQGFTSCGILPYPGWENMGLSLENMENMENINQMTLNTWIEQFIYDSKHSIYHSNHSIFQAGDS